MDERSRPLNFGWLLFGFLVGLAVGLALIRRCKHRRPRYLARSEYWVYIPGQAMPSQEAFLTRMIGDNPHNRPGRAAIGAREGMLLSDVRFHMAVAVRAKNPHAFRPDLFAEAAEPTAEILQRLPQAQALIKVRYVSEEPLADDRHLQFLPHAAGAIASLAEGLVVYDLVAERLWSAEAFSAELDAGPASRPELQVNLFWRRSIAGGSARTYGLAKVGLAEWETDEANHDQEVLILDLMREASAEALKRMALPEDFAVEAYGDRFTFEFRLEGELTKVRIKRFAVEA